LGPSRVVLDTNVFVSGLLFGGKPGQILSQAREESLRLLLSAEILEEYIKVLSYPKFDLRAADIKRIIREELIPFSEPIRIQTIVRFIRENPSDDKFLALAVDGKAEAVISGDRHLLGAGTFRDIPILSVEAFLAKFRR
jgi:putative PIN family toxin of toxin-antitoxin system